MTIPKLGGFHHFTAIASDSFANREFYAGSLGLRLLTTTVNFDDPGVIHLIYGNDIGTPGSLVTFFVWPGAEHGRVGAGSISRIGLRVPGDWAAVPDGLELRLSSGAPRIESVTLRVSERSSTERLLTRILGFETQLDGSYQIEGATVHIDEDAHGPATLMSAGVVHHIAFRVRDAATQASWRARLLNAGVNVTPIMNRMYWQSIYFQEPGPPAPFGARALFELATEGPGFSGAQPHGGSNRIDLPPWYEPHRTRIEAVLRSSADGLVHGQTEKPEAGLRS